MLGVRSRGADRALTLAGGTTMIFLKLYKLILTSLVCIYYTKRVSKGKYATASIHHEVKANLKRTNDNELRASEIAMLMFLACVLFGLCCQCSEFSSAYFEFDRSYVPIVAKNAYGLASISKIYFCLRNQGCINKKNIIMQIQIIIKKILQFKTPTLNLLGMDLGWFFFKSN